MDQLTDFFKKLFDTSDFPPRWHCGRWSEFHGWLYIVSDLLIWSAYFTIPLIIIKYLTKKQDARFLRLYVLFAAFILACGATHFLDAITFWIPLYRLNAFVKFITGVVSWITVWYLFKYLPVAFSQKSVETLEKEIEQRKKAEEEVRLLNERLEDIVWEKTQEIVATESRFRSITESSMEAISLTDESFIPFYQNPFAENLMGWTVLSMRGINWKDRTHREDIGYLTKKLNEVSVNPGKEVAVNFRTLNVSGQYISIEGTITNLLSHQYVKAIVFNLRDITEKKKIEDLLVKSERIYRTISANLPNSTITLIDRDNNYLLAEGEGLPALGRSKETVEGRNEKEAMPRDMYDVIVPLRNKAFSGSISTHELKYRNRYFFVRFIPIREAENEVSSVMTISQDITDIKKAEIEIKALNESLEKKVIERTAQLESANKELEAFSYSVSHDLRAPLRIIHGYSDILRMDHVEQLDKEGLRLFEVIMNNIKQMGVLIDELLNFSRLGKKELTSYDTDMNALVKEIIREQSLQSKKNIEFKLEDLLHVVCDRYLIRNVWNNLISNAIKYSSKTDAPVIEINSSVKDGYIIYSVKDNGVGFDMKYHHKLFGVFSRLHKKTDFEGTGVGLALVQRIVLKHQGNVWAEAEENAGATFYFSIPNHVMYETI